MSTTEWVVIVAGLTAIAWINWYFLGTPRRPVEGAHEGLQRSGIPIMVDGGYEPSTVRVRKHEPVRLVFERKDDAGCTEEVVFPDFGIRTFLPQHRPTVVTFTPTQAGAFTFSCGMGMLRGRLIVQD